MTFCRVLPHLQRKLYSKTMSTNASKVQTIKLPKQHEWNRAVSHAEKLVGFPSSAFHLQTLMSDDVTGITEHMRKLMGSDHPVLKSLKRLVIHGGQVCINCINSFNLHYVLSLALSHLKKKKLRF